MPGIPPTSNITTVEAPRVIAPPVVAVFAAAVATAAALEVAVLCFLAGEADTEAYAAKDANRMDAKDFIFRSGDSRSKRWQTNVLQRIERERVYVRPAQMERMDEEKRENRANLGTFVRSPDEPAI